MVLLLIIPNVFAFNPFYKILGLFVKFSPEITAANVYPVKIRPGDVLLLNVTARDVYGIDKVTAKVYHENGFDLVELNRKKGNNYQGTWICHHSLNMKWYDIDIEVINLQGISSFTKTQYQDPTKSHPAAEVTAGTFDVGDFTFQGNVSVSSIVGWDGWIPAQETWLYDSSDDPTYTFNINGNKTGKYSAGMKLKLTQTSEKYFYIAAVSYSSPNTTITVNGAGLYNISNAAITSPYYSHHASPLGFPIKMIPGYVKARAYLSADQDDMTVNTWNKTLLNTESYDIDSNFDTANNRFVVPITGYYHVIGRINWEGTSGNYYGVFKSAIYVDPLGAGSPAVASQTTVYQGSTSADQPLSINIDDILYLTATDRVYLYGYNSLGVVDVDSGSTYTFMAISLISVI